MDPGEVQVDPVHDEFFKMQDLADALVRESIQNSLDARRGRAPVRVRFRFGTGAEALPAEAAQHYFHGLREHLTAVSSSIHSVIPRDDENVPYLLIEDFGTRGLTGDPSIDPELDDHGENKNDFFYFWRNVGRSNKGELDRGRWGLGKAVFTVASRIRTIFGLTVRADDMRPLLLGQSVLKTHILKGSRVYPYGFFARFEKGNGLPLPIEEVMLLERFADDFQLHRDEPGLSVVVPYFREDELSPDRLLESSIRQYFYPILRGDLVVDVESGLRKDSLTERTIDTLAARFEAESSPGADAIGRLCLLTRWSLSATAADERIELSSQQDRAPRWSEEVIDAKLLSELQKRFERGERIAFRVPLLVKRKRAKPAVSFFDVYLEKDEALRKGEHHFIRRGITIPEVKNTAGSDKSVRALVVVDQEALSTFLGDAENPAHSDWSERADKLRTFYDHHAATLRFVKNSAAFLASILARPPEGRVRDLLEDIFFIEIASEPPAAPAPGRRAGHDGKSRPNPGSGRANGKPRSMSITRIAGGFALRGTGEGALVPGPMIVDLAYRTRTGNPFRKHSPLDFDLAGGEVAIDVEGASFKPAGSNAVELTPELPGFAITMKGFDRRRDLLVRIREVRDDAPEAELY